MLLQKGIDIKTIQHFLGHSQASTTVNIYLHSISNGTVDAANAIGSMVNVGTVFRHRNLVRNLLDSAGQKRKPQGFRV